MEETIDNINGFTEYRRKENGYKFQKECRNSDSKFSTYVFDNRDVVPYNPYLIYKYGAHINVERCGSIKSIKYLYKYVYKGHDRAYVKIINEIDHYLDCRYLSAQEACWRLFQFEMQSKSHSVKMLQIHLENRQQIIFKRGQENKAVENIKPTMLTGWFDYNKNNIDAQHLKYTEFGELYVWGQNHIWHKREVIIHNILLNTIKFLNININN